MKGQITLSVETSLIAEARGAGLDGKFSKLFEEAIRERLKKPLSEAELQESLLMQLKELRSRVHQKSMLYRKEFEEVLRRKTFLGLPKNSVGDKIAFWQAVLEELP